MDGYVLERTEDAWLTYIQSSSLSASVSNFYHGVDFVDKEGHAVIVYCPSCEEVERGSGVYRTQAQITLKYVYENSGSTDARNVVQSTFNNVILGNSNILNALTGSTTRLMVLDATFGGQSNTFAGDAVISTLNVDMVVAQTAS